MMRFLRLFSRRQDKASPAAPSPEQWQAGDQAECLVDGPWFLLGQVPVPGPRLGEVRPVVRVEAGANFLTGQPEQFLHFERYPIGGYAASNFRKVSPRADEAVAADAAFLEQLRPAHVREIVQ